MLYRRAWRARCGGIPSETSGRKLDADTYFPVLEDWLLPTSLVIALFGPPRETPCPVLEGLVSNGGFVGYPSKAQNANQEGVPKAREMPLWHHVPGGSAVRDAEEFVPTGGAEARWTPAPSRSGRGIDILRGG